MTIKNELHKRLQEGAMPLSDFMSLCLYHPQHGYYTSQIPIGSDKDFTTAPEISQLFGEMIALWALDYTKGSQHNLIECGPGKGTLLSDIARVSQKYNVFDYNCLEISPRLKAVQKQTLGGIPCGWAENFEQLFANLNKKPCVFIANEFFDAIPIDQYIFIQGKWHKRHVALEGDGYVYKDVPCFLPDKLQDNYATPKEGDVIEYSPAQKQAYANILSHLNKVGGALIAIDYGHVEYAYGDTFQAIKNHQSIQPLRHVGEADLTSHVNFACLRDMAMNDGFHVDLYTQGDFLQKMGIKLRCEILCKSRPEQEKNLSQGLDRLINKMGYLFKVIIVKSNEEIKK